MKYRHAFHAGNFADVHKHVTLLALLAALARKDKGFLFVDTHAGCGLYDLDAADSKDSGESRSGVALLLAARAAQASIGDETIDAYLDEVSSIRHECGIRHAYPGSPLLAARRLRAQDRAILIESETEAFVDLRRQLRNLARVATENADGYARLPGLLPPRERRALVLIDPPFEDSRQDFQRIGQVIAAALERFASCVIACWYPIKLERDIERWHENLRARFTAEALVCELHVHPLDSRAGLNGSGLVIVNPPYLIDERLRQIMPLLRQLLCAPDQGGWSVRPLGDSSRTST